MVAVLNNQEKEIKESLWDESRHAMNELDQIQATIKITMAAILSDNNIYDTHAKDAGNLVPILEMLYKKTEVLNEYIDINFR